MSPPKPLRNIEARNDTSTVCKDLNMVTLRIFQSQSENEGNMSHVFKATIAGQCHVRSVVKNTGTSRQILAK